LCIQVCEWSNYDGFINNENRFQRADNLVVFRLRLSEGSFFFIKKHFFQIICLDEFVVTSYFLQIIK